MVNDYDPSSPMAEAKHEAIQNVRLIVSPVTADAIGLCLASRLAAMRQSEAALDAIRVLKEYNSYAKGLRMGCQARIDRLEKARQEKARE
jgi:hypothetical protein